MTGDGLPTRNGPAGMARRVPLIDVVLAGEEGS